MSQHVRAPKSSKSDQGDLRSLKKGICARLKKGSAPAGVRKREGAPVEHAGVRTRGSRCAHAGHTRGSRCAHPGQPVCTHEAYAGQSMCIRGAAGVRQKAYARTAGVRTRGSRCAHEPMCTRKAYTGQLGFVKRKVPRCARWGSRNVQK
eukprot:6517273-Pyramimonas_sp.AAC.2